jgi:hypothetical protein
MRLGLEPFGDFAYRGPVPTREALGMQHQLILQDGYAFGARGIFAEPQEASQSESEI